MHLSTPLLLVLIVALLSAAPGAQAQCRRRREIRNLSGSERAAMMRGFQAMAQDGTLDRLRRTHSANLGTAHNTEWFALWHRAYLMQVEDELLAHTSGLSGLPFIDLSRDASDPASSPAFSANMFGQLNSGCLLGINYDGRCLERNGPSGNWGQCAGSVVASIIRGSNDYRQFSGSIEGTCHNRVHSAFPNSAIYSTGTSPIDPFFHPFHAGIDYFFAQWQNSHSNTGGIDLNRRFLGKTVAELFAYSEGSGCYSYEGVNPPTPVPTPSTTTTTSTSSTTTSATTTTSAAATPTGSPNDGRNAGNATDPATWIPDFEKIPDEWFASMPNMFTKEQIDGFNRVFATAIQYLRRLRDEGKPLPTMNDFKSITGNSNWTSEGIKKMQGKGSSDEKKEAAGSGAMASVGGMMVAMIVAVATVVVVGM